MTATGAMPQHMQALRRANDVRLERAAMRREVAQVARGEGCTRVAELLEDPPDVIATLAIFELLQWPRWIGRSQARAILRMHGPIGERREIQTLTPRQRRALAEHFRNASLRWERRAR